MLEFSLTPYTLKFKEKAITSRDSLVVKDTYILKIWESKDAYKFGVGEVPLFKGLSAEDSPDFFARACVAIGKALSTGERETGISSVNFGLETALASLNSNSQSIIFPSAFTKGECELMINGLIWMGDYGLMKERIESKISEGYKVIKIKIGGIDFEDELRLLDFIRRDYSSASLTIRLDANCSFSRYTFKEAIDRLKKLSTFDIHSIEQPFAVKDFMSTAMAVKEKIIPIALDEQLIGVTDDEEKNSILDDINPDFIVLKPSLCGGFSHTARWIELAEGRGKQWWITSALESAIGLNALAQFTALQVAAHDNNLPQGLGTGELYTNDFPSHIRRRGQWIYFNEGKA